MYTTLTDFNRALKKTNQSIDRVEFMRESILHGTPFVFQNRENDYFRFRASIANQFEIGFYQVFIVGSAKLGFSYLKRTEFSLDSDVDVVIVSPIKFESVLRLVRDYEYEILQGQIVLNYDAKQRYYRFLRYLARGWMRPDLLPYGLQNGHLKNDWFDFFNSISYGRSSIGNYKVAAGLFKDYEYLEKYYMQSVENHYDTLRI